MPRQDYTSARAAWVECAGHDAIVYVRYQTDKDIPDDYVCEDPTGQVPDMSLVFQHSRGRHFSLPLTRLTAPELEAMKELVDWAFDKAIPVAQEIDEQARLAMEDGDDANPRLYRPVPVTHRRARGE